MATGCLSAPHASVRLRPNATRLDALDLLRQRALSFCGPGLGCAKLPSPAVPSRRRRRNWCTLWCRGICHCICLDDLNDVLAWSIEVALALVGSLSKSQSTLRFLAKECVTAPSVWETGLGSPQSSGWPGGRPVRCGFICIDSLRCDSPAVGRCQNCRVAICERHMALFFLGPHARVLCIACVRRAQPRDRVWEPSARNPVVGTTA